jgi:hypothetical protein
MICPSFSIIIEGVNKPPPDKKHWSTGTLSSYPQCMKWLLAILLLQAAHLSAADKTAKMPARIEAIAQMLTPTQRMKLLDLLNKGRDDSLRSLPGVGETRLAAIKQARPFNDITEVTKVPGVGEGTFIDFVKHAKAGFPKK